MSEVHVCDIVLQTKSRSVDRGTLAKVSRRLGDLAACAPRLHGLLLGELIWSLVPIGKDLALRLSLVPIRQGWLFDPLTPGASRPANLEAEALAVFEELSAARVRVTRLAQALAPGNDRDARVEAAKDPLAELLVRQSRRQWHICRGQDVVQLDFPAMPAFYVDSTSTVIAGVLSETALGRLTLKGVVGSSNIEAKEHLRVECSMIDSAWLSMPAVGSYVRVQVRFHRCVRTDRVVGAVLEGLLERDLARSVTRDAAVAPWHRLNDPKRHESKSRGPCRSLSPLLGKQHGVEKV
jgi:hypothetical protein